MAILEEADFPAIRACLDTELNSTSLPDSTMSQDVFMQAADRDVTDIDPDAETRTGTEAERVRLAAIYFCAARLAPAVVRITSMSIQARDLSLTKQTFDPTKRAEELRALAAEELAAVLEPAATSPSRPTTFAVAPGYRGR